MERRDRRGRKIGYNWWRSYNCDLLLDATLAWERVAEEASIGYETELLAFSQANPRPNLKEFLLRNKGMNSEPEPS